MLMFIFNKDVFYIIQIICSIFAGTFIVGGAALAFSSDENFRKNLIKQGRKKIIYGTVAVLIGLIFCYSWTALDKAGFFEPFREETYGTPEYLVNKRIKNAEKAKLRSEEIKKIEEAKALEKEAKKKAKEKEKLALK